MSRRARPAIAVAAMAIAAYLVAVGHGHFVRVRHVDRDPCGWGCLVTGPAAEEHRDRGRSHFAAGLDTLRSTELGVAERLAGYRRSLELAETELRSALAVTPAYAEALALLATTRWELEPAAGGAERERILGWVRTAGEMAPGVAQVQRELGELLLRMGARDAALDRFAATLELRPDLSNDVIALLRDQLYDTDELAERLPSQPRTLAALRPLFRDQQREADYLALVEDRLAGGMEPSPELLAAYGTAGLREGRPDRVLATLLRHEVADGHGARAEWWRQRSLAESAAGRHAAAVDAAIEARRAAPGVAVFAELLGDAHVTAGDPATAIGHYREGLADLARREGHRRQRARLYRKIGEAEERRGDAGAAYDAYRRSLQVDPDEPFARRRLAELAAPI